MSVRWTVRDRYGNEVYLTDERWQHITAPYNHPEMIRVEDELKQTIRSGARKRDEIHPQKFRYTAAHDGLPEGNTHIVAIVLFRHRESTHGKAVPNNYIVTGYLKELWWKT